MGIATSPSPRRPRRRTGRCGTAWANIASPDRAVVLGAALGVNLLKIGLAPALGQPSQATKDAGRPLRGIVVLVAVEGHGWGAAVGAGPFLGTLGLGTQPLGFAVEGRQNNVEAVALGTDKGHLLVGVAQVRRDQGPRVGDVAVGCGRRRCSPGAARRSAGGGGGGDGAGEEAVEVGAGVRGASPVGCWDAKPG